MTGYSLSRGFSLAQRPKENFGCFHDYCSDESKLTSVRGGRRKSPRKDGTSFGIGNCDFKASLTPRAELSSESASEASGVLWHGRQRGRLNLRRFGKRGG